MSPREVSGTHSSSLHPPLSNPPPRSMEVTLLPNSQVFYWSRYKYTCDAKSCTELLSSNLFSFINNSLEPSVIVFATIEASSKGRLYLVSSDKLVFLSSGVWRSSRSDEITTSLFSALFNVVHRYLSSSSFERHGFIYIQNLFVSLSSSSLPSLGVSVNMFVIPSCGIAVESNVYSVHLQRYTPVCINIGYCKECFIRYGNACTVNR